eukprot:SAG31_NODE_23010_length_513_cov_1.094203_1_plen_32_part_01
MSDLLLITFVANIALRHKPDPTITFGDVFPCL